MALVAVAHERMLGVELVPREVDAALVQLAVDQLTAVERNMRVLSEAFDNAKQWLVASSSNADLGVGDPDDLADAFGQYARTRADYLQAVFAYVYGLEQLAHAAGHDVPEVQRLAPPKP